MAVTTPTRSGFERLTRPALDDAHIRIRPDGRQLVIDRGGRPTPDTDDADRSTSDADEGGSNGSTQPKRERITSFSAASRRRLRKLVHSLRRDADCTFLTLTWHQEWPTPEEAKRALDTFLKRMRRRFPGASAVWKMEPQKRGMPHFHLLVFGLPYVPFQKLSAIWHECTEEASDAHRRSGVDVEHEVNNDGKLQGYLAKYMSKETATWPTDQLPGDVADTWEHPGRYWGVFNRDCLPYAPWADWVVYLDHADAAMMIAHLLDEWGIDLDGVIPPSLTVNTRGDPEEMLTSLLAGSPP